ncbi:MAG: ABC transporter substrate-binding protein [Chloroflexi bacterium]|nr:ABC transporter substrate-binding protein [Chloroflexota bacterium]
MRIAKPFTILLALGAMLLAACAPAAAPAPTQAPAKPAGAAASPTAKPAQPASTPSAPKTDASQPKRGGALLIGTYSDPPSFDIAQLASHANILSAAYNGLLQYDPQEPENIIGDLAEKWEANKAGDQFTFYLRKGVKWHDGAPFSSADAKFSIERMLQPPRGVLAPRKEKLEAIDKVEAPDDNTLKISTRYPTASLIPQLATTWVTIYSRRFVEAKGDMKKDIMGTGPFRLKDYSPGAELLYTRNPDYFVKDRPLLDSLRFFIVRDVGTRFAAFRTGKVRLLAAIEGPTPAQAEVLKKQNPDVNLYPYRMLQMMTFIPLVTKAPWNDVRVRRAVELALDRQAAIKVVAQGYAELGHVFTPGAQWGLSTEELAKLPGFRQPKDADVAAAKRLLEEAGYPNGFKTTLSTPQYPTNEEWAVFLKAELAKIGIDAQVLAREVAVERNFLTSYNFDVTVRPNSVSISDPDEYARYYVSGGANNFGDYRDPKVDELFAKQARTMDLQERKRIILEIQNYVLANVPRLIGYWNQGVDAAWKDVRGYRPGIGKFGNWKFQEVWLAN